MTPPTRDCCECECHLRTTTTVSTTTTTTTTTTKCCCHLDIELSNLGRLENVVSVVIRLLQVESDSLADRQVIFRLALERRRAIIASLPLIISHFKLCDEERNTRNFANITAEDSDDDDDYDDSGMNVDTDSTTSGCGGSSYNGSVHDYNGGDQSTNEKTVVRDFLKYTFSDVASTVASKKNDREEALLLQKRCIEHILSQQSTERNPDHDCDDNDVETRKSPSLNGREFFDRVIRFASILRRYRLSRNDAERQRLDTLKQLLIFPNVPVIFDTGDDDDDDDWTVLNTLLFFQWFRLMLVMPVNYDPNSMNFLCLSE